MLKKWYVDSGETERRGFTLIELLVVIAIIMILAAILFPVFGRAQENAKRSACSSNMRQIALGIRQYRQDHDSRYPPAYSSASTARTGNWITHLGTYAGDLKQLVCPSAEPTTQDPYTYGYNADMHAKKGSQISAPTVVILNWEHDSTFPTGRCGTRQVQPYGPQEYGSKGCPFPARRGENERHLEGSNFSFVDGHVKWYTPDKILKNTVEGVTPTFKVH